jgi:hypothetical protein
MLAPWKANPIGAGNDGLGAERLAGRGQQLANGLADHVCDLGDGPVKRYHKGFGTFGRKYV